MKIRTTALILALLMLLPVISCAEKEAATQEEITTDSVTEEEIPEDLDSLEARKLVSDGLPDIDCEGREFRILGDTFAAVDFLREELKGEIVDDAIYQRNSDISERFNTSITAKYMEYASVTGEVQRQIGSQDDNYNLISWHEIEAASCAQNLYFINWYDIDYVNPQKPWWTKSTFTNLSIGGKTYLAAGAVNLLTLESTYCMYVNKSLAEAYNINGLEDTVLNGDWTIDRETEIMTNIWEDVNGNGKQDKNDFYGLTTNSTSYATTYVYSFGEKTVTKDADDIPYIDINQEKYADMLNRVYKLFYEVNGTYADTGWDAIYMFQDEQSIFSNGTFYAAMVPFRSMEKDYSIIPYPKWDEKQPAYYTMADGSASLMAVPITNENPEFVGLIIEAMNAESWKHVIPAAYDIALKVKGTRDESSVAMIDLIYDNQIVDLGFIYSSDFNGVGFIMANLISNKKNNFSSYYARNEKSWNRKMEKIIEKFTEG